jgi:hypothetical protein
MFDMNAVEETDKPVPENGVGENGVPSNQGGAGNTDMAATNATNTKVGESDEPTEQPNPNVEQESGTKPQPTRASTKSARVHAQTVRDNEVGRHEQLAHGFQDGDSKFQR